MDRGARTESRWTHLTGLKTSDLGTGPVLGLQVFACTRKGVGVQLPPRAQNEKAPPKIGGAFYISNYGSCVWQGGERVFHLLITVHGLTGGLVHRVTGRDVNTANMICRYALWAAG